MKRILKKILFGVIVIICVGCASSGNLRPKIEVGMDAPYAKFDMIDGNGVLLESFKGKIVAIQFWAADCNASSSSIKKFVRRAQGYAGRDDIVFLAVSLDTNRDLFEERITAQRLTAGVIHAYSGNGGYDEVFQRFGMTALPSAVLINREGKVIDVGSTVDVADAL